MEASHDPRRASRGNPPFLQSQARRQGGRREPAHLAAFDVSTLSSAVAYIMSGWKQAAATPAQRAAPEGAGDDDGSDMPGLEGLRRSLYVMTPRGQR